jgi:hypothetical protein
MGEVIEKGREEEAGHAQGGVRVDTFALAP